MRITDLIVLGIITIAIAAVIIVAPKTDYVPSGELKKFSSQAELNNFVKNNAGQYYSGVQTFGAVRQTADIGAPAAQESSQKSIDYSKTNVQVEGVDEADIIKSDGKYLYIISGQSLVIVDAYPGESAKIVSKLDLNKTPSEIFINGNKLIIFGYEYPQYEPMPLAANEKIARPLIYPYYSSKTFIQVYDLTDKENPVLSRNFSLDGDYFDSRMIGNYAYVVINQPFSLREGGVVPLPMVYEGDNTEEIAATDIAYFDVPDESYRFVTILSLNTQNDDEEMVKSTYMMGYSEGLYVSQNNIYITYMKRLPYTYYTERLVEKVLIPLVPSNVAIEMRAALAENAQSYEKMQKVQEIFAEYFNTLNDQEREELQKKAEDSAQKYYEELAKETQKTVVHKIAIDNGKIEYKSHGEVPGNVLNQFSMDEHNGYFRIATTTNNFGFGGGIGIAVPVRSSVVQTDVSSGSSSSSGMAVPDEKPVKEMVVEEETEQDSIVIGEPVPPQREPQPRSWNHVYVLDSNMQIVGKLENLAPDERIYSARFIGDRLYLVTFVQIDPLFVIDLSDPTTPKVLGELKIPGVSQYLHPYDETHIIGVGKDAIGIDESGRQFALFQGIKISLFDVSNVANPKEVAKFNIGDRGTESEVLYDHKAFLFDKEKNLLIIPITLAEINPNVKQDPVWAYGEYKLSGAYVFDVSLENGFILRGIVKHHEKTDDQYYYGPQVRRSMYIDDTLYTVSSKLMINRLSDLNEIKTIELPKAENYYGGPIRILSDVAETTVATPA